MTPNNQWMLIKFQALYQTLARAFHIILLPTIWVQCYLTSILYVRKQKLCRFNTHFRIVTTSESRSWDLNPELSWLQSLYPWTPDFICCYKGAETAWVQREECLAIGRFVSTKGRMSFICSFLISGVLCLPFWGISLLPRPLPHSVWELHGGGSDGGGRNHRGWHLCHSGLAAAGVLLEQEPKGQGHAYDERSGCWRQAPG